ncbi:hypothetical protein BN12_220034 [Nostocoides japonicum T1-X7]|uniref:Uncharacterized protein n=1 Tax=Nostocoides japonicum T1-X7 TaxID=1194083 RepID=A0A077LVP6_9MICO|nr:hypothetical protein [Tetrasphaera japonica]CCH77756.1 hypothetical protein BN12_220034 [Tetrasphaera japonica T1-X7]
MSARPVDPPYDPALHERMLTTATVLASVAIEWVRGDATEEDVRRYAQRAADAEDDWKASVGLPVECRAEVAS